VPGPFIFDHPTVVTIILFFLFSTYPWLPSGTASTSLATGPGHQEDAIELKKIISEAVHLRAGISSIRRQAAFSAPGAPNPVGIGISFGDGVYKWKLVGFEIEYIKIVITGTVAFSGDK
jgi:hypothetical protein